MTQTKQAREDAIANLYLCAIKAMSLAIELGHYDDGIAISTLFEKELNRVNVSHWAFAAYVYCDTKIDVRPPQW